jgi:hypothetical protein
VAVVDDEPGAGGALVDGRHVHLLPFPRHDPSRRHEIGRGGREQRPIKWEGKGGLEMESNKSVAVEKEPGPGEAEEGRVYRRRRVDPIGTETDGTEQGRRGSQWPSRCLHLCSSCLSAPLFSRSARRQDLVLWDLTGFLASAPKKAGIFLSPRRL